MVKGKASIKFNNVYLRTTATVSGPREKKGPLGDTFDYSYMDAYCECENWEQAEMKLQSKAMGIALEKAGITSDEIDVIVGGDLNNQIAITNYNIRKFDIPFLGIYSACATSVEAMIIAALLIDKSGFDNVLTVTSSHNSTSERQFRYPTEYGGQKPNSMTSTATGAGVSIISKSAAPIKITGATIGKVIDPSLFDSQDMGRTMAPAAANVLKQHLEDFGRDVDDYDLILTGDLSKYGSIVFREILKEFNIIVKNNYKDAGNLLYDTEKQEVFAGGSGIGCISLVAFSSVIEKMKSGLYSRVLLIATGALLNPIMVAQNESIPAVAHAIVLERSK